jgi:hypothetical protein
MIEGEIWERGNMCKQIEIQDEHHTILGLHLKSETFLTRVTNLVFYMFCMSLLQTFPPKILNSND